MKKLVFDIQRFDNFENWNDNATVTGTDGDDYVYNNSGSNVKIFVGAGNDSVYNDGHNKNSVENAFIDLGDGNDYVSNLRPSDGSTLIGGAGSDTLYNNYNQHILILGGGDSDSVLNYWSEYTTIYGGEGNDIIGLGGYSDYRCSYDYADGGAGNDTITSDSKYETIIGGAGDDYISLTAYAYQHKIVYSEGDGNDTVYGFATDHTLLLNTENYSKTEADGNVIIQVGDGSITFLNRNASEVTNIEVNPSVTNISKNGVGETSQSTGGGDTSQTTAITYEGGNKTVTNYAGEKINYHTDFTGIGFNDTDFIINSSSGSLTIQNARDKVIDVAINNNTIAYVYMASGGGEIDGRNISQFEIIIGGNNASNIIYAGSGGSSLWGGFGGTDTLTGGEGYDTFFYGKNDGADVINNAGSIDLVYLYDISLSDISEIGFGANQINLKFASGGTLQVNSAENLSPTIQLAEGDFKFNHSTNTWQGA
ncbi:MAG: hypothetical protein IJS81_06345 [Selenomonadaceae bacterium]|nr:hypothetical protein [Selenomonadaceae bacterium]